MPMKSRSSAPADMRVAQALKAHRVLGQLDDAARADWLARLRPKDFADGALVVEGPRLQHTFGLLLEGRLQWAHAEDPDLPTLALQAPDWFGAGVQPAAALGGQWRAQGPCRVALLDAAALAGLCEAQPLLRQFLEPNAQREPLPAAADPLSNLMQMPVRTLLTRQAVTVSPQVTVHAAAQCMRQNHVSSLMLVQDGRLVGLVTDRDLRNRVLAAGRDPMTPLGEIATPQPRTIASGAPGFEALLLMARHRVHHVPVLDGDTVTGMLTATDVTRQQGLSPVFLASEIHKQDSLDGLVACAGRVKPLQQQLAASGASAYSTGHIVTAITDALTVRLLELGEQRFGPPPVPYAWVAAGSQARNEQTAKSDQDNCMILDDAYQAPVHGAYFKDLSTFVCDGLHACGYVHCPGEMMAMTDQWRQPRSAWAGYFHKWIDTPEPMALMLTCVFFDVRTVAGTPALLEGLRAEVLRETRQARLFLALMVGNALTHQPPLGLFGGISTVRTGPNKGTIDLKHSAIVPIIDLARIYALAAGHPAVNTYDRLEHAAESGEISAQSVRDLRGALAFLGGLRIRHQARLMAAGHDADNHLRPDALSNFEREQLKEAFGVVKSLQDVLAQRYRHAG
jgi:CBS domain-containing protein